MNRPILFAVLILAIAVSGSAQTKNKKDDFAAARAEILPLLTAMHAAANERDAEKHVSFYARDASLLFIINDEKIVGYEAVLAKQRQWWRKGKTGVEYKMVGEPDFTMPARGLVMVTYFLTSSRTLPNGKIGSTGYGISALWQKRPDGWRIIYAHESTVSK